MTPAFCSSTWRLAAWDQMIFQNANELPTRRHNNMQKWNDTLKSKSLQHLPQLHRMFWDVLNAIHNPIFVVLVASLCLWSCKCLLGQSQTLAVQGMATAVAETLDNIRPWLLKPYKSYKIITFLLLKIPKIILKLHTAKAGHSNSAAVFGFWSSSPPLVLGSWPPCVPSPVKVYDPGRVNVNHWEWSKETKWTGWNPTTTTILSRKSI